METKSELHLSGPDKPLTPAPLRGVNDNTVSAPADVPYLPKRKFTGSLRGDTMGDAVAGSSITPVVKPGARITAGSDVAATHDIFLRSTDPDYEFYGSISEEMLHRYLDRSITMAGLASHQYDTDRDPLHLPDYHSVAIEMLHDIRPKFIKRLAAMWDTFWDINTIMTNLRNDIDYIHTNIDSQIICEGAIFENIDRDVNNVPFPPTLTDPNGNNILALFGQTTHNISFSASVDRFDWKVMQYDGPFPPGVTENTPDITKVETQMWVYYVATRYIDCGCEAIHFGQTDLMSIKDPDKKVYWDLVQKIRAFARTRNRGIVICSGGKYHYPDGHLGIPLWERKLIFDFNSLGIYYTRPSWFTCTTDLPYGNAFYPAYLQAGTRLLNDSPGGWHPQGWVCKASPIILEFDHGDANEDVGCSVPNPAPDRPYGNFYGWDNISWFAANREDMRNLILVYTYYKIKCLDPYAHLDMPGRRPIHAVRGVGDTYRAATSTPAKSGYNQQATIKAIWNGAYTSPFDWLYHNFTHENVMNGSPDVASNLIFADPGKMYYIGTGGTVHGYIKVSSSNFNGGTWLTVSPSFAADLPAHLQVKAKSGLVASPDGTRLLYIGVDDFIYGFDIVDAWTYRYFSFGQIPMKAAGLHADSSLIYPAGDRIYYIARRRDGTKRVHGFYYRTGVRPGWEMLDLADLATRYMLSGSLASQFQAAGALTYDHFKNRLYYRTIFGTLAYYNVRSATDYSYTASPGNFALHTAHLQIWGDLALVDGGSRIYFICRHRDSGQRWVYFFDSGTWDLLSVSERAGIPRASQVQSAPAGHIAVSPDGRTIAYFGDPYPFVCYYHFDGVNFSFHRTVHSDIVYGDSSLQFISNTELFYTAVWYKVVQCLKFSQKYCGNPAIYYWDHLRGLP